MADSASPMASHSETETDELRTVSAAPAVQKPVPKPRRLAPKTQNDQPVYDVPRPATNTAVGLLHDVTEDQSLVMFRERSSSATSGVKPQPKPRRAKSVYVPGTSLSADSSPLLSGGNKRTSMHPTPLVQALKSKLISQIESVHQEKSEGGPPPTPSSGQLQTSAGEGGPPPTPSSGQLQTSADGEGAKLTTGNSSGALTLRSKSPIAHRQRANSDSKAIPRTPPPYGKPKSRLSKLISAGQRLISRTPPPKRSKFKEVTEHGTPFPSRPAPLPPQASPKPAQDSTTTTQNFVLPSHAEGSGAYPVYEDLDRTNTEYETIDRSPLQSEESEQDSQNMYTPPPTLPLRPDETLSEDESLPPLPPRSTPRTVARKHRYLTNHSPKSESDGDNPESLTNGGGEEAALNTGKAGPREDVDSDQSSEKSYTDMSGGNIPEGERVSISFTDDQPEDIYIEMDPSVYIEPPESYKPKKNQNQSSKSADTD